MLESVEESGLARLAGTGGSAAAPEPCPPKSDTVHQEAAPGRSIRGAARAIPAARRHAEPRRRRRTGDATRMTPAESCKMLRI
ncbi:MULTISPECIES: hypothetical protein [Burkholderia]|uniref:Uncharacterized protein n=1 Tax=Burkholderia orbicola TaxID=2978683 RepID=A0ABT8NND9_9BURK|nr:MULTISPECIES: hypothetical protein [Burkholderia]EKS9839721.1 hypothetical protein [Burkholderia cepacia]MBJ9666215.1 hypothetical protein [Burkholderia cenocepacia]MBJ9727288.1 hypothetical protein [Burkholderia cenocepacia]MBJ9878010.1 hypothetical protein [Burkholderia cenocepacia]MBJ9923230.1 hypothetical protein [Burkholderia cenocepacia]